MYLLTLLSAMLMPNLSSSPWMRGAPQRGFSRHILRIRSRTSRETTGRPRWPRRTFQVQNRRKAARCQATTVSGLTMVSAERQWHQRRERQIHKRRSPDVNFGRAGADLLSTPIWWRRARFSSSTAARERRIEGRIARNLVRKTPDRRRPIHVAVTEYPTAEWVAHQLLEAIPWDSAPRTWSGIGMEAIERGSVRSHTGWVFGKF